MLWDGSWRQIALATGHGELVWKIDQAAAEAEPAWLLAKARLLVDATQTIDSAATKARAAGKSEHKVELLSQVAAPA